LPTNTDWYARARPDLPTPGDLERNDRVLHESLDEDQGPRTRGIAVIAGTVFCIVAAWRAVRHLDNQVAAVIVASATVMVSVGSLVVTRVLE
jgi:hypothetical protein